jgi:hypothetical protein
MNMAMPTRLGWSLAGQHQQQLPLQLQQRDCCCQGTAATPYIHPPARAPSAPSRTPTPPAGHQEAPPLMWPLCTAAHLAPLQTRLPDGGLLRSVMAALTVTAKQYVMPHQAAACSFP